MYVGKEMDGVPEEDGGENEEEANGGKCPCRRVLYRGAFRGYCHDNTLFFFCVFECDCFCSVLIIFVNLWLRDECDKELKF